jgi:hypothetical protein
MVGWRTGTAKTIFWCAGLLSRVRTPQRVYATHWPSPTSPPIFTSLGWHWSSCRISMRLLTLSEQIDPGHWEHWAIDHSGCPSVPCPSCGGQRCPCPEE